MLAFDLDPRALKALRARSGRWRKSRDWGRIFPVMADVDANLPLRAGQLDLAVAVHCSIHDNLAAIDAVLAPGGLLVYETFGGHGENWRQLPKARQLQRKLGRRFELLILEERLVGPANEQSVVVRLFARKHKLLEN